MTSLPPLKAFRASLKAVIFCVFKNRVNNQPAAQNRDCIGKRSFCRAKCGFPFCAAVVLQIDPLQERGKANVSRKFDYQCYYQALF